MKPFTRSIIDLFDSKRRYLIPLYQRKYAWRQANLELLWDDIIRAVGKLHVDRSSLTPHFMGAMVINQVKTYGMQVQAYEVIDGQQRLTTFQLLLAALRDVAKKHKSKYENEATKFLLNEGVMERHAVERYKLWPTLTDRRAFIAIIEPEADVTDIPDLVDEAVDPVTLAQSAYDFFRSKIADHVQADDPETIEFKFDILYEALKDGLAIVSIELEAGDDPQTIFETLNSRGIELTPADLMRNFIFQRATGLGQQDASLNVDKLYKQHWLPLDRPFWQQTASRGRQKTSRINWMLTDHLAMQLGQLVPVDQLFSGYRRWVLDQMPPSTSEAELKSISATAAVEQRLFEQSKDDALGRFGRFADAFDVSTAMPLVIYIARSGNAVELEESLGILESYILRRDICGLTTKNYNKGFVGIIDRLRRMQTSIVETLKEYLSTRKSDIDRWPDDEEFRRAWLTRDQYRNARQPRLRYILEVIEQQKRTKLNEEIEIKSDLTIEHIMPQSWRANWPVEADSEADVQEKELTRETCINKLGNLTLLTHPLNVTVSNGPFSVKLPALKEQSSLALNRELSEDKVWNEAAIKQRGQDLFSIAAMRWEPPLPIAADDTDEAGSRAFSALPDGTQCVFEYGGKRYFGNLRNGALEINGFKGRHFSFSSASKAVTQTSRNGWRDWTIRLPGSSQQLLADDWRRG
ncbi:DUF262 domain-containing protein [Roseovarius sp. MS2]|uniref:DUF262 domain-containing protein n=1 Tax=Roseovarius sp. MS2 TaxID=3390728 RepID=UPI003EDBA2DC